MTYAEKAMATHSSTLAWKIPWMGEPGRLQSMGSPGVRHDWATSLSCLGEGNGNPLQCSCLENPRDGGAWWAAVYGVAQSRTRLKWLSSSSSSSIHLWAKGMATHSSICAWTIPWTEETCKLQSLGLQRVRHDWSDWAYMHTSINPTLLIYLSPPLFPFGNHEFVFYVCGSVL